MSKLNELVPLKLGHPRASRPTIHAVAKEAGVSIATVSRVLNYPEIQEYSPEVKAKVVAASKKLNYRPNAMARSLARQVNPAIGVLCQSLTDVNITQAVDRVVELATVHERHVVVTTHPERVPWVNLLNHGSVDWVISINHCMVEASSDLVLPHSLERIITVTPWTSEYVKRPFALTVTWDTTQQGLLIADHLAGLGHREIALLLGNFTSPREASPRLQAVQTRAQERGMTVHCIHNPEEMQQEVSFSGRIMMRRVLTDFPQVTAVVCRQDYHATGVYTELYRAGKRIPEDMAVVGTFNLQRILQFCPPLTSVDAPLVQGVELAMDFLLGKAPVSRTNHIDLTDRIRLWERESTVGEPKG